MYLAQQLFPGLHGASEKACVFYSGHPAVVGCHIGGKKVTPPSSQSLSL